MERLLIPYLSKLFLNCPCHSQIILFTVNLLKGELFSSKDMMGNRFPTCYMNLIKLRHTEMYMIT